MALQVIVERLISTIEVLYIVEFFKATDRDGQLSVPHGPNEGFGRLGRLPGREFGETLKLLVIPMNIDARQGNFRCNALQPGENEYLALACRTLADDDVSTLPFRDRPTEQSQSVR